jgi:two-component system cell cycle response regulator CtrA
MHVLLIHDTATSGSADLVAATAGIMLDRASPASALALVCSRTYDAVVIEEAKAEGCVMVRRMRTANVDVPVVILSTTADPDATVLALEAGADDVISKPFDRDELAARLYAVARRGKGLTHAELQFGAVRLRRESQDLTVHGKAVAVTEKEFATLELLLLRKGTTLSKEAFLTHLYGGADEPHSKIVDVFICKLRRKLAQAGASRVIETVWGHGYVVRDQAPLQVQLSDQPGIPVMAGLNEHMNAALGLA